MVTTLIWTDVSSFGEEWLELGFVRTLIYLVSFFKHVFIFLWLIMRSLLAQTFCEPGSASLDAAAVGHN